ncbi:flagellar protein FlaG [Cohnella sp. GbtcB17]|uniref:flagellar protein FlaG n=1 Tax=Cohnella sp. GbtcB17 TaxID=2824762 RepID=UPI001C30981D|nr:flagellar protein FlaG [Cohnella sp. GbtcB17]
MDIKNLSGAVNISSFELTGTTGTASDSANATSVAAAASATPSRDLLHKEKYELSLSDQAIKKAIEKANKAMDGYERRFEYSVHQKTGDLLIKVVNTETNEVMREIPNEKLLDLMDKLQELAGINIDEKR